MIRSTVRKHRVASAAVAALGSLGLLILACETPTPLATATETGPQVTHELEARLDGAPAELQEAGEGYYVVKKTPEGLEYIGPVDGAQVEIVAEDGEAAGYLIRAIEPDSPPVEEKEQSVQLRRMDDGDGPKPLVIVDGVISSDPDILSTLDEDRIESIEVVKGASAEALYGARAAGGVILITMTKG